MQEKKRLLFVNGHLNIGGVEKSLIDLLRHLDYSKYEVDLLLVEGLGDYYGDLPTDVNVIYRNILPAYGPFIETIKKNIQVGRFSDVLFRIIIFLSGLFGKKIMRLLSPLLNVSSQYDLAIAYRTGICESLVAYSIKSRKKSCWWHHGECNYNQKQIAESNRMWKCFSNIVTVSNGCKRLLSSVFSYPENKIIVIPNLIDIERINELAGFQSPYQEGKDNWIFVTVGRLSEEKHIDNVPLAARMLKDSGFCNFKWYIIGDGDMHDDITRKIHEQDVGDDVVMLGKKSNPYPYMKFADVLVHTSYVESQSITVLEAMALKTLCVVTRSIGPEEFIESGKNGILVESSLNDLVNGITQMVNIEDKNCMLRKAYNTVQNRYVPKRIEGSFSMIV